ncbi:hypothetical protein [Nocardia sp. NPDC004260]
MQQDRKDTKERPTESTSPEGVRYADQEKALQAADKLSGRWSDLLERLAR